MISQDKIISAKSHTYDDFGEADTESHDLVYRTNNTRRQDNTSTTWDNMTQNEYNMTQHEYNTTQHEYNMR